MIRFELPGTDRHEAYHVDSVSPTHPDERHEVTLRARNGHVIATDSGSAIIAGELGLSVSGIDVAANLVHVTGTTKEVNEAFGVKLENRDFGDAGTHVVHTGPVSIPDTLKDVIEHVSGLDKRPVAKPHFRVLSQKTINLMAAKAGAAVFYRESEKETAGLDLFATADKLAKKAEHAVLRRPPGSFTPLDLASLYDFPTATGAGQCIGIIELGGGYRTSDLKTYFADLGLPMPTVSTVSVNGGKNSPTGDSSGPDGEVMLDIEVAGAIAPKAKIAVYFAPNTSQGFINAITQATHDKTHNPSVISISWGGPESTWSQADITALDKACQAAVAQGITICVAAGDNGSDDGVGDGHSHADFPGSSPHVLCTGGSHLVANGSLLTEVVWNDGSGGGSTGGGVSAKFAVPAYQVGHVPAGTNGRGVPDVSADASPETGYVVLVDSQQMVIGGTSACAPLWAGLVARLNQLTGKRQGLINTVLYKNPGAFRDIVSGNNGAFSAGPGFDFASGLGVIVGTDLLDALKGEAIAQ